ncbi:hypothetical protein C1645_821806 [Glomus cerebriforme]|uniref:Uncharacterized protein n=1 Tax=Glomus cerebriforme TaxID=658196 RepID=A0A397T5N9_9GLOM|nr:hypothetical protein C1645_821806 [Glomus cerebriforme]
MSQTNPVLDDNTPIHVNDVWQLLLLKIFNKLYNFRRTVTIEKSDNDDNYRLIRLSNELEALLIHDAKTDKSSADGRSYWKFI